MDERGAGVKHLTNIFRRLHRIFAHAWFQHRGVFWQVEGETGLYVLFKSVCDTYDLLPAENYKLPPEAEGLEPVEEVRPAPSILKSEAIPNNMLSVEEEFINVGRTNTRRHIRQSPSVGSAVTTVLESDEEDPDVTQKLENLHIADEEGEAEVPVIVETYVGDEAALPGSEHPVSEQQEHIDDRAPVQEASTTSTASSWDIVSSEPDKPELEEQGKPAVEEAPEETHEETHEDVVPASETESKEESHEEKAPAENEPEEEKNADKS